MENNKSIPENKRLSVPEEGYVNRPKEEYLTDLLFNFNNDTKRLTNNRRLDTTLVKLNLHE